MTRPLCFPSSARVSVSICRNASSPSVGMMSVIFLPTRSSRTASASTKRLPCMVARACPTVVLPQPGIPMRMMFSICARRRPWILAIFPSGICTPANHSALSLAWATSIQRPFMAISPRLSASSSSCVLAGLYTTSSTPSSFWNRSRLMGLTPVLGYMPTGVVLTMTAASVWRCRLS